MLGLTGLFLLLNLGKLIKVGYKMSGQKLFLLLNFEKWQKENITFD